MRFRLLYLLYFSLLSIGNSQSTDVMKTLLVEEGYALPTPKIKLQKPVLNAGGGVMFYTGNMRVRKQFDKNIRPGMAFQLGLEQRFAKHFGIQTNLLYGNVISTIHTENEFKNFKTQTLQGDIRLVFNLELLTSKKASVAPFFNLGIGWLNISSKSNLLDKDGKKYFAWKDGTLRTLPEINSPTNTTIIENDYRYETDVTPTVRNMPQAIAEIGIRFKILNFWDVTASYSHFQTWKSFTAFSGKNDSYGFLKVGIQYYFGQVNFKRKGGIVTTPTE